ncbi:hypothetical protein MKW92_044678, partial [Papaver armeniacum]
MASFQLPTLAIRVIRSRSDRKTVSPTPIRTPHTDSHVLLGMSERPSTARYRF